MKAGELCKRDVTTARADTSIRDAARLMREHHVGCLVIMRNDNEPAGIVTDRDIVIELVAGDVALDDVTAGDIMSRSLLKVTEDETVFDTARRMRARGVRRVPVIGISGGLVGILAMDDILALLGDELSTLSRLCAREAEQETNRRSATA